jgi:SAM-dependent methyltransferase
MNIFSEIRNRLSQGAASNRVEIDPNTIVKLCDPIDQSTGRMTAKGFKTSRREYPISNGYLDLTVEPAEIEIHFGRRNYRSWRELQDNAEKSYAERTEGHFSVDSLESSVSYGEVVGKFKGEWLDVGCGKLAKPSYMKKASNIAFYGIDPIDMPVERDFPFVRAIGDFLPFKNESFDGVMFSSALDHCISPLQSLEEAFRVIKPGGYVLIWETIRPDDVRFKRWMTAATYFQARYNRNHNWGFTKETLEMTLRHVGFKGVSWRIISSDTTGVVSARKVIEGADTDLS